MTHNTNPLLHWKMQIQKYKIIVRGINVTYKCLFLLSDIRKPHNEGLFKIIKKRLSNKHIRSHLENILDSKQIRIVTNAQTLIKLLFLFTQQKNNIHCLIHRHKYSVNFHHKRKDTREHEKEKNSPGYIRRLWSHTHTMEIDECCKMNFVWLC